MEILFLIASLMTISCASISHAEPPMRTVDHVDLNRYLGNWYEISSFPQWFQKDCFCTRANYSLKIATFVDAPDHIE